MKIRTKLFIVLIFLTFITLNINAVSKAYNILDNYYEVQTEEGKFYKRKEESVKRTSSSIGYDEEGYKIYLKTHTIIENKIREYMKKYTSDDCEEDKRINEELMIGEIKCFSYEENKEIYCSACVRIKTCKKDSTFWNSQTSYLYYLEDVEDKQIEVRYFVRLTYNEELKDYEIAYIDFKPENYDALMEDAKSKGFNVDELDIEQIFNIKYSDNFSAVPIQDKKLENENKTQIQTANNNNLVLAIRTVFAIIIFMIIVFNLMNVIINKKDKNKK